MRTPFLPVAGLALGLGLAAAAGGCASAPALNRREVAVAHVVLVNLTGQPWRVALQAADGGSARIEPVAAGATADVVLAPGRYFVEQALLAADGSVLAKRSFPTEFAAAETYQWPLATARSTGASTLDRGEGP